MPSWKGNSQNPAPNTAQQPDTLSEKKIGDNRAHHVRRDQDDRKDFTIGLYDIDESILIHLEKMNLHVVDDGNQVKVPFFFGSPDKWVSAKRDGYIRDKQGKIILPAMILKRTNSEMDPGLQFFNRYVNVPVMRKYSEKNRYTQFTALAGRNTPVREVFNMVMPSHMVLTYQFIIWTESVEQMNKLVEQLQYDSKDYWGSPKGFRFRTKIDSFGHTTELVEGDDRVVKTEFNLTTHGYVLPETLTKLDSQKATTQRMLTPKKVIMGVEVVRSDFDMSGVADNSEKWRNLAYPNLRKDDVVASPPLSFGTDTDSSGFSSIRPLSQGEKTRVVEGLRVIASNVRSSVWKLPPPETSASPGEEGEISFDNDFYYIYSGGQWKRVPIALFNTFSNF